MDTIDGLSHKELLQIDHDYEKAAAAAHLLYVNDRQSGITRKEKGKGFAYLLSGQPLKDEKQLERIRKLAIPPSWTNVWICAKEKGHIQATGSDLRQRKQYRYHTLWNSLRTETKFHRLYEFGKALPALREKIASDLAKKDLCQEKVLATIISLMERTYIRVGNNEYEKTNGSYGLTTLKNRHVAITGDKMVFSFVGKKGIHHDIQLKNKKLARIVSQCQDIPGKELFQYYDADGTKKGIDSGMVNDYIRHAAKLDFTAKDFRTWAGSLHALQAIRALDATTTAGEIKKNVLSVLDTVSVQLGNTRTVCRKYYVHPALLRLYEENKLGKYLQELDRTEDNNTDKDPGLTGEEKVLMKILKASME